ncbi:helix-turn-helix domain-containing protein [Streptomyces spinosirectus]|uniref:helix-turn-helix transcriptional regulator n=1 Tax=Streptomyces TaxID=1883 RepID=UPI001C9DA7A0|nr:MULTISPECIES: helix-turn-helix transcriptional regulator [Streptomyces]MBY8342039.1 helix-turn-helix transcriptional regulator [Streptomyces plumbidurans]UIR16616.1 helix-turn-helix domain-containing protein [Streptomyces spinosirectus]
MPRDVPDWIINRRRELGVRIRDLRIHANHTQESLAQAADLDRRTLQRIEAGQSDPRFGDLLRIAAALEQRLSIFGD